MNKPFGLMWGMVWRSVLWYTVAAAHEGHENSVTDVDFSTDEQRIISAGVDRRVLIWPMQQEN